MSGAHSKDGSRRDGRYREAVRADTLEEGAQ